MAFFVLTKRKGKGAQSEMGRTGAMSGLVTDAKLLIGEMRLRKGVWCVKEILSGRRFYNRLIFGGSFPDGICAPV
jgi:hypothetical protein